MKDHQTRALLALMWSSITCAIDIFAKDGFFALALLSAAHAFRDGFRAWRVRIPLVLAGARYLANLSGTAVDMRPRSICIGDYAGVFPVAAVFMPVLFHRTAVRPP